MRNLILGTFAFLCLSIAQAQTTTNCLEIEDILVDACGNPEGQNEMVRILVGPNPLNVNNLNIAWANTSNAFFGFVQNAATGIKVSTINATITGCGYLKEPVNGIIPANKKAIIVTSYLMNPTYNSFANLNDTLYIIFQNSTLTSGHFANYDPQSGVRTLSINYLGCTESVSYNRNQMINVDGAGVSYTQNGTPTYYSGGCNAPVTNTSVTASFVNAPTTLCAGASINLTATYSAGTFIGWSENGVGSFVNPNLVNATYNSSINETGPVSFYAMVRTACGDTVSDTISINLSVRQPFQITPTTNPISICQGQPLTLSVPSGNYTQGPAWSNLAMGTSITITNPGTYIVGASDGCFIYADTVVVNASNGPAINLNITADTICPGDNVTLQALNVVGTVSWNTGAVSNSITVTAAGTYTATVTNNCGTASASAVITIQGPPTVSISGQQIQTLCQGSSLNLQAVATGANSFVWSNNQTGSSINVTTPGVYTVTAHNDCGTDQKSVEIILAYKPVAAINPAGNTSFCKGGTVHLVGSGDGTFLWSTGSTSQSIQAANHGNYTLIVTNECGSDTANMLVNVNGPTASFDIDGALNTPTTINYFNTSTNADTYEWFLANGETSNSFSPSQYFNTGGDFLITLIVTDANGCKDSVSKPLLITEPYNFYLPNIFTPNGDSINDKFFVVATGITRFRMAIFNRWGELIYESLDIYEGWDGSSKTGQMASSGVYIVVVDYVTADGKEERREGHVTLIK